MCWVRMAAVVATLCLAIGAAPRPVLAEEVIDEGSVDIVAVEEPMETADAAEVLGDEESEIATQAASAHSLPLDGAWHSYYVANANDGLRIAITLTTAGKLTIADKDPYGYDNDRGVLLNASMTRVVDSLGGNSDLKEGGIPLRAGTYYVWCELPEDAEGTYRYKATFSPIGLDEREPNNSFATAMELPANKTTRALMEHTESLDETEDDQSDDVDYYRIRLASPSRITFTLGIDYDVYTTLEIFNSVHKRLASASDNKRASQTLVLDAGTYYLRVTPDEGYFVTPGTYTLLWKSAPLGNIADARVSRIKALTYNGKARKPSPTIKVGTATLKKGRDYTLSYKKNKNAGTAKIIITGKGAYVGTKTITFKIKRAKIAKAKVSGLYTTCEAHPKIKPIKEQPKVKLAGRKLKYKRDYTLSYKNNKMPGTATITIKGKGNYYGTRKVKHKIKRSLAYVDFTIDDSDLYATPKLISAVYKKGTKWETRLVEGRDFRISFTKDSDLSSPTTISHIFIANGKGLYGDGTGGILGPAKV